MTGPRPAGRPWTAAEEAQLSELLASGMEVGFIARKLKRSPGAIYARTSKNRADRSDKVKAAVAHPACRPTLCLRFGYSRQMLEHAINARKAAKVVARQMPSRVAFS